MAKAKTRKTTAKTKPKSSGQTLWLAAALVAGVLLGFTFGYSANNSDNSLEDAMPMDKQETMQSHGMYMVSPDLAPTVNVSVAKDAKGGWNVELSTTKFTFTPDKVNQANVVGEGHAHLYVNGQKVARLYSPYYHYNGVLDDEAEFRVTLNSNDHSEYHVEGQPIEASVLVYP